MVRFRVNHLGDHRVDNMVVTGPNKMILMEMVDLFLAGYSGKPDGDLDYHFAKYVIDYSYGQGEILEWEPSTPGPIQ